MNSLRGMNKNEVKETIMQNEGGSVMEGDVIEGKLKKMLNKNIPSK